VPENFARAYALGGCGGACRPELFSDMPEGSFHFDNSNKQTVACDEAFWFNPCREPVLGGVVGLLLGQWFYP
jgi:hypothetical protein